MAVLHIIHHDWQYLSCTVRHNLRVFTLHAGPCPSNLLLDRINLPAKKQEQGCDCHSPTGRLWRLLARLVSAFVGPRLRPSAFGEFFQQVLESHPTGELAQRLFSLLHFCRAQAAVWGAQCNFSLSQHINCILTTCHTRGIKTYYCSHSTTLKETNRRLSAWIALLMSLEGREERHPYHGLLEQQS